jgi:hypothetical protein
VVNPAAHLYADYALACAETGDYRRATELMATAISLNDADAGLRSDGSRLLLEWRKKL